jgi:hypothetical protein
MKALVLLCMFFGFLFAAMPDYYEGKKVENIEVFDTRGGKKIAIKWIESTKDENGAIIIAINGGHGKWELKDSHITPSRIGAILAGMKNYRVLSLDMPSDEYGKGDVGGYGNEIYRLSRYQIDDINSVLESVNKSNAPVYLLTTSKSTISGINAAGSGIKNLKGVILTAISADLTKLAPFAKVPTLWIHHKYDKCFDIGIERAKKMALLAPKSVFVEVANEASVSGKECSMTNYHGFVERDMALAKTIDMWIDGKEVQGVIK